MYISMYFNKRLHIKFYELFVNAVGSFFFFGYLYKSCWLFATVSVLTKYYVIWTEEILSIPVTSSIMKKWVNTPPPFPKKVRINEACNSVHIWLQYCKITGGFKTDCTWWIKNIARLKFARVLANELNTWFRSVPLNTNTRVDIGI